MKLSIVIPCYNAVNTIGGQLEALASQFWLQPWEVIVSDNGSSDGTIAVVEKYMNVVPNLRLIFSSTVRGAGHARNAGILHAKSEAIAFCDADDEVAPGWVAAMGKALSEYEFVACKREYRKLNEAWTLRYRSLSQINGLQEYKYPPYLPHASSSTLGVRRSVHESIGGFDEAMLKLQDIDYCWRIQLAGFNLHFISDAVVHYRLRDNIKDLFNQAWLWGEYNVYLYKKYQEYGMPKLSLSNGVKTWVSLCKSLPRALSKKDRDKWVWQLAARLGRLHGCIKYKVLAL